MAADEQERSKLVIAYDGTAFKGWAVQPGLRTVEGELLRALKIALRRDVPLTVAGRTDTGVHADAQVASHDGQPATVKALNALLPSDIAVSVSELAEPGFCARREATSRAYIYALAVGPVRPVADRTRTVWWAKPVDVDLLNACAALLPGQHDMTAFTPTQTLHTYFKPTILTARWIESGNRLEFHIEANWFLRHMNRILVGTMIEVASGERSLESFEQLLAGASRLDAGPTARPHGLRLVGVGYGEEVFSS